MIETRHAHDEVRRVPVYSLYSETREPTAEMLAGPRSAGHRPPGRRRPHLHLHLHDGELPEGGARSTACKVIVCDRPNPIGGAQVEGTVLVPGFESFVGMFPIPMRHGMTIGELARLFNDEFGIGADLEVIPMEGWRRDMYFDATGLTWIISSPNIPTLRHDHRVSRRRAVRGHERLGRPRDDTAVRADRRAVGDRRDDSRRRMNRRATAGRVLPAGAVRADVSQARRQGLRRLPGPRPRSPDVPGRSRRASR